ncbi:hypothetical protein B0A52_06414 [Exophiala mesophila]|uniref:Enoyl reductase (ER) domain-containing protein n=1 Tax=Exophiala mesophila TaxID=212818 RepID=A0A438N207_EXOME|nr:hypothetical protein B0A52_06414 [Exophiala mesophila]
MVSNKGLIFKNPPINYPTPGQDIAVESRDFDLEQRLDEGAIITKNCYLSFDPYQRVLLKPSSDTSYNAAFPLGQPFAGRGIGQIVKSNNPSFKIGDLIRHILPIEEYTLHDGASLSGAEKLSDFEGIELPVLLGALDGTGLTAYSSYYDIGQPKKGETILISGAGGAVGQIVGQLAKRGGLKVYASVGSDDKLKFLVDQLGFDGGFNYKNEKPLEAIKRFAPDGLDIYYDNVGGEQLDAALVNMKLFGRIVACGMISTYNQSPGEKYRIANLIEVIFRRLTMRGFQVLDAEMGGKYAKEHQENFKKWIRNGSLKPTTSLTDGIDHAAEGFVGMLKGQNNGKAVLKIAEPDL